MLYLKNLGIDKSRMLVAQDGSNAELTKRYKDSLVGNSPELMPLDSNLFSDLEWGIKQHIALTAELPNDGPAKFALNSPKRVSDAMLRTWAVTPTSERIVQDIERWEKAVDMIIEADGGFVECIDNRSGRRKISKSVQFTAHPSAAPAAAALYAKWAAWEAAL